MNPIFTWVGGKRWLAKYVVNIIKPHLSGSYYEPFLGGGAVFFELQPHKAILCDSVEALISTYRSIQQDPLKIWQMIKTITKDSNSADLYYILRNRFNHLLSNGQYTDELAALFVYLNKTGYNGVWRQNSEGEYNIPYGTSTNPKYPTASDLMYASSALSHADLRYITSSKQIFDIISNEPTEGDVIFADPPYYNCFNDYDVLFESGKDFHEHLSIELQKAVKRGVTVLITNVDCKETRQWYKPFENLEIFNRSQSISGTVKGRVQWNQLLAIGIP